MKYSIGIVCTAAFVASCAGGPSPRQHGARATYATILAPPAALFFAGMDGDGDAVVGREEMAAALNAVYDSGDVNPGGSISIIRMSALLETWLGSAQTVPSAIALDIDGSGSVSRGEFTEGFERQFVQFDVNGDGRIERSELLRSPRALPAARGRPNGQERRGRGGRRRQLSED